MFIVKFKALSSFLKALWNSNYSQSFQQQQQKLWSNCRVLGSQSEGCGFDPHSMLDGCGVKAMPS